MPQNQFLPVAAGVGANTLSAAAYAGAGFLAEGFQSGIVPSIQFNTVLRQLSTVVAALGQFTADNQSADVLDDGVVANFETKFKAALSGALNSSLIHYGVATGTGDAMVVTASPPLVAAQGGGYQAGSILVVKTPTSANATTGPTLNGNSIGNITIANRSNGAVAAGDLPASSVTILAFDGTRCNVVGTLPSDIGAIVASYIAPLSADIQDAIVGNGLTYNSSDPTQLLQSLAFGGLFIGSFGGGADALTATIAGNVTIPALKVGMRVSGFVTTTNVTTSPTLAVAGFTSGSAAASIKKRTGASPSVGDVAPNFSTFRWDGTNWRVDGVAPSDLPTSTSPKVQTFTVSGTYTPTPGAKLAIIKATAGGGGGSGSYNGMCSAGGGSGGTSIKYLALAGVAAQAVTIGAGGTAGSGSNANYAGGNGGATSVGSIAVATGGLGATTGAGGYMGTIGGDGGIGTAGDVLIKGGSGNTAPAYVTYGCGANGGGSIYGGGGAGSFTPGTSGYGYQGNGQAGGAPGSGGGGSGASSGGYVAYGGAGAPGIVEITEYF